MPLALLLLGSGLQLGNGCCSGCWMVAATGPASPQQPEVWQWWQQNREKTNNPQKGCLLLGPLEPGPGLVRWQLRKGGFKPAEIPGCAAAATVLEAGRGERPTLQFSQPWK